MTLRRARQVCNNYVQAYYPGYFLLMDRLNKTTYAALWGRDEKRLEIVFPRTNECVVNACVNEYKIS